MPTVTLMVGVSGSGKSTKAKEMVAKNPHTVIVCRDDIRRMLFGVNKKSDYKFTKDREKLVTAIQFSSAKEALDRGKDVIVADTNLSVKTRDKWYHFSQEQKVTYAEDILECSADLGLMQERNALREDSVPPKVVNQQWQKFMDQYGNKPVIEYNHTLPDCVICDIDGTLAKMSSRSPFDWHRVYEDSLVPEVADYLTYLFNSNVHIILLSGRDGVCESLTKEWLYDHKVEYDHLYMREKGDNRKDTIIKQELYEEYIEGKYNVIHVIDDRPQVIDMWHDLGLKVWSVSDQRIKF